MGDAARGRYWEGVDGCCGRRLVFIVGGSWEWEGVGEVTTLIRAGVEFWFIPEGGE